MVTVMVMVEMAGDDVDYGGGGGGGDDDSGGGSEMVDNVTTSFCSFNNGSHLLDAIVFFSLPHVILPMKNISHGIF